MRNLPRIIEFEWDEGNLDKSYRKHGVTIQETEEIFISEQLYVAKDIKHSEIEERFIAFGKTNEGKYLFVVFTFRYEKVRIISARRIHKKEVEKYEKAKEDTKV